MIQAGQYIGSMVAAPRMSACCPREELGICAICEMNTLVHGYSNVATTTAIGPPRPSCLRYGGDRRDHGRARCLAAWWSPSSVDTARALLKAQLAAPRAEGGEHQAGLHRRGGAARQSVPCCSSRTRSGPSC